MNTTFIVIIDINKTEQYISLTLKILVITEEVVPVEKSIKA